MLSHEAPQFLQQFEFTPQRFLLCPQHFALPLVELGRGVSLGVLDGLLADVVGGYLGSV